jgi:RNA polymerase sigma-70 factor (ECF subfamily)
LGFDELYDAYFAFVWRALRRLGVADAHLDDAAQDVFLVVHRKLEGFEGRASLKTWLYGIVLRVARRARERQAQAGFVGAGGRVDPDEVPDRRAPTPHESAVRAESLTLLQRVLDGLDDEKREAFVLIELDGLTAPEAALVLGVPVNTVSSRLRLARAAFDRALARLDARERGVIHG